MDTPRMPTGVAHDPARVQQHLSHISTLWTLVQQAHQGTATAVSAAQQRLLERYSGAAYRYLLGALRDSDAADDLFQEFSLRLLRGDFHRADPGRGRFRDIIKTTLFHLIVDHQRARQRQPRPLSAGVNEPAVLPPTETEAERAFLERWREELLDRTWLALAQLERKTGQPCHTVLRLRLEQPALSSAELAEEMGRRLGKPYSVPAVRQALYRAREKVSDLLLDEVVQSLENPTVAELEQELGDLGLLSHCRAALERRGCG
jgi:RNA polymerase sigma factor (sigma-70 family)